MKKLSITMSLISALLCASTGFATDADTTNAELQQAISALQSQIDALKQQVSTAATDVVDQVDATAGVNDSAKKQTMDKSTKTKVDFSNQDNVGKQIAKQHPTSVDNIPHVLVAPYIGTPSQFNGSELIVNNPSINDDLKLLQMRQAQNAYYEKMHQDTGVPRIIFSGYLEGQLAYTSPYSGTDTSDVDLTSAELDTFIEADKWLSGYLSYTYDNGADSQANPVNNSNLELSQGFVTIGNLDESRFYSSVGQLYVPFGRYSNFMISDPMTKTLGRTKTRALVFGYSKDSDSGFSPYASVYAFNGATEVDNNNANDKLEEYGMNAALQYSVKQWAGVAGVSYISSIASSQGLQGDGDSTGFAESDSNENLSKDVPGFDAYASIGYDNYTVLAEFTTATEHFDADDLSFNGEGAKPQALDLQAAYAFTQWRPSFIAADLGKSWNALGLGLPEYSYGVTYGVNVWRHTLLSFQLLRNNGYSTGSTATSSGSSVNTDQVGNDYNSATLQLDMYF